MLAELCEKILAELPEGAPQRKAVLAVKSDIDFFLLPELEMNAWRNLARALIGVTPDTEWGARVIELFNTAASRWNEAESR